jgi:hypothetical protein
MRELGVKELENIDKAGVGMKKVWEPYKNYRKRIVEICGTKSVEGNCRRAAAFWTDDPVEHLLQCGRLVWQPNTGKC